MAKYTKAEFRKALIQANGIYVRAAEALDCERSTIYRAVDRFDDLKTLVADLRAARIDRAESKLDEAIEQGAPWAVALVLKTLGRERGYGENLDVTSGGEAIPITTVVIEKPEGADG